MSTDPKRWQRIKEIVAEALELPPEDRGSFLSSACAGDEKLEHEARELVALGAPDEENTPSGILDDSALAAAGLEASSQMSSEGACVSVEGSLIGQQLGPYRVLRRIGEGGMGVVYEAEQERPARRVALKVLQGRWATGDMRTRFEHEIEALGRLEHPGIARIYGAGRDEGSGVVYFAMELVDGVPLTEVASSDLHTRIGLLAQLCDAVHHAHMHGVIHRDLKPDNVLVDREGRVRVLDFGIARFVEGPQADETRTVAGQLVGTLAYMSPEQVSGDPTRIDLRSDVYALGVLCYELLAKRLPYDFAGRSLTAKLRAIEEETPAPPSRFEPTLRGDIDLVLLHALAKEPELRYSSAAELAADLRRVLRHEPITVRPPTLGYIVARFVRRHRAASALAALALLLLITAVVGTSIGLVHAERERARAVRAAEGVRDINEQLLLLVGQIPPELLAGQEVIRELLRRWQQAVEEGFAEEPRLQREMFEALGWAQYNLGLWEEGAANLSRAWAGYRLLMAPETEPFAPEKGTTALLRVGDRLLQCRSRLGVDEELLRASDELLKKARRVKGGEHPRTLTAMATRASLLHAAGQLEAALELYEECLAIRAQADPFGLETLTVRTDYALALQDAHKLDASAQQYEQVLRAHREQHNDYYVERRLNAAIGLSQLRQEQGAVPQALELQREIVRDARRHWGEGQLRTLRQANRLVSLLKTAGKKKESQQLAEETARISMRHAPASEESFIARNSWIHALLDQEEYVQAATQARALLTAMQEQMPEEDPRIWTVRDDLANALAGLGRYADAEREFIAVLGLREKALGRTHVSTLISLNNLAWMLLQSGSSKSAASRYAELMQRSNVAKLPPRVEATFGLNYGRALLAAGRAKEARIELERALATLSQLPGTAELVDKTQKALEKARQQDSR
jgi:tetratricopeptide (TPR) repeat protein